MILVDTQGMPTSVLGASFRDFYQNHWPKDWYAENLPLSVEDEQGRWVLPDDAEVDLTTLGLAVYEGPDTADIEQHTAFDMERLYHTVMGTQPPIEVVVFRLNPVDAERLREAARTLGLTPFTPTPRSGGQVDPNV